MRIKIWVYQYFVKCKKKSNYDFINNNPNNHYHSLIDYVPFSIVKPFVIKITRYVIKINIDPLERYYPHFIDEETKA